MGSIFGKKVFPRCFHRSNLLLLDAWEALYEYIRGLDCCGLRHGYRRHATYRFVHSIKRTAHGTAGAQHPCIDHHQDENNQYILATIACAVAALQLR